MEKPLKLKIICYNIAMSSSYCGPDCVHKSQLDRSPCAYVSELMASQKAPPKTSSLEAAMAATAISSSRASVPSFTPAQRQRFLPEARKRCEAIKQQFGSEAQWNQTNKNRLQAQQAAARKCLVQFASQKAALTNKKVLILIDYYRSQGNTKQVDYLTKTPPKQGLGIPINLPKSYLDRMSVVDREMKPYHDKIRLCVQQKQEEIHKKYPLAHHQVSPYRRKVVVSVASNTTAPPQQLRPPAIRVAANNTAPLNRRPQLVRRPQRGMRKDYLIVGGIVLLTFAVVLAVRR
jgi:hypothetical protein